MAELYRCDPPPGAIEFLDSGINLFLGQNANFRQKKAKKNRPKNFQKWPKSGQKWPKLPQNRRNKSRGSPRKSQRIPKISDKWPKTLPQCNMKMHQNSKNGQKSANIMKKIDFPYNNFPKMDISLRKCTPFFFSAFGEKKS